MSDDLGDRMKLYERIEAGRTFIPLLPVYVRIDGRCFSSFTKGMARPYDERLSGMMVDTTTWLVQETNAVIGYTQSDEISLAWLARDVKEEIFFAGRIQKMVSQLAAMASVYFYRLCAERLPDNYRAKMPTFDARVFNLPNQMECANAFLWREQDATKNAISMAARHYFSHKQLENKNGSEMQEMLFQLGVNFNNYPAFFKRGTFVQRRIVERAFTVDELSVLPPLHEARKNPGLVVKRTEYRQIAMPPFGKVVNRIGVIFDGEEPREASAS